MSHVVLVRNVRYLSGTSLFFANGLTTETLLSPEIRIIFLSPLIPAYVSRASAREDRLPLLVDN